MIWNDHKRDIPKGSHAFLSPSNHSWCGYDDDKLLKTYINKLASVRGTLLHELAQRLILMKVRLPEKQETLNMYVNDAIRAKLEPEKQLYYSKFCYGTADAIGMKDGKLVIYDLKTGKIPASFVQLEIYAALFFLEYPQFKPDSTVVELRIYQSCEMKIEEPELDVIVPIMDRIRRFSKMLQYLEDEYDDGFGEWL